MTYQPKHFKPGEAPEARKGGIGVAYGMPGVGKTQFCIKSWEVATPLWYCNFDRDASHLIKTYQGKGGVFYDEFSAATMEGAQDCLSRMEGMRNAAMSTGQGVFVIDNWAAAWETIKLAKVKGLENALPKQYEPANSWARHFLLSLERSGLWCLLTAPGKEIWSGAKTGTGLYESEGWKHQDFHILFELWLFLYNKPAGAERQPQGSGQMAGEMEIPAGFLTYEYKGQIMYAKRRPAVEGMILKNPTLKSLLTVMKEME